MVPYSNHINNPQKESKNPRAQSIKDAPTEPTEERIEEGVKNIPVPMIRPTLHEKFRHVDQGEDGRADIIMVQLKTPKCRPIPPATSRCLQSNMNEESRIAHLLQILGPLGGVMGSLWPIFPLKHSVEYLPLRRLLLRRDLNGFSRFQQHRPLPH